MTFEQKLQEVKEWLEDRHKGNSGSAGYENRFEIQLKFNELARLHNQELDAIAEKYNLCSCKNCN